MEQVTFLINGEKFVFDENKIPERCLLRDFMEEYQPADGIYKIDHAPENFKAVYNYLMKGILPKYDELNAFTYFCVSELLSYELAALRENYMRENMYKPEFKNHEMNTDSTFALQRITKSFWNDLKLEDITLNNMLFKSMKLEKNKWENVNENLEELRKLLKALNEGPGKCFIAGGKVFNSLFKQNRVLRDPKEHEEQSNSDIDIFVYGCTPKEAEQKIHKLHEYIGDLYNLSGKKEEKEFQFQVYNNEAEKKINELIDLHGDKIENSHFQVYNRAPFPAGAVPGMRIPVEDGESDGELDNEFADDPYDPSAFDDNYQNIPGNYFPHVPVGHYSVIRTKNAISISVNENEYQIVLRLYNSPSEILHGFDVDCCSVGFDGESIWITQRALYSIMKGYNTVNFDRLSPSYEVRLIKYATRGMKVHIPNFDTNKIYTEVLDEFHQRVTMDEYNNQKTGDRYSFIKNMKGIDRLIYLEYRLNLYNYNSRSIAAISNIFKNFSDYSRNSGGRIYSNGSGNMIEEIIEYLIASKDDYKEASEKYIPLIDELYNSILEERLDTNPPKDKEIKLKIKDFMESLYGEYVPDYNLQQDDRFPDRIDEVFEDLNMNYLLSNKNGCRVASKSRLDQLTKLEKYQNVFVNTLKSKSFNFIKFNNNIVQYPESIEQLLHIPRIIYDILAIVKKWDFEPDVTFKVHNPGEQMTNTFNKIVLEDNKEWYKGQFYEA